jgi:hypothetical protein
MSTLTAKVQLRRDTATNWATNNPILAAGEIAFTSDVFYTSTDQQRFKIGDGTQTWSQLDYVPEGSGGTSYPEHLYLTIVNKTGDNLLASGYKVLRVSSAQGQRLAVDYAQADSDANSTDTIGVVYENISNNQEGKIVTIGELTELNTTGSLQGETWADGDVIYLSPFTAGQITNIKPTAPNHLVTLGYVVYAHANHGKIYIKCDNGYELQELHNVYAPSPSNNDSIFWSSGTSRYENKSIATVLGYTPASSTDVNSKGYVLNFGFSSFSPADATNYYVGQNNANPFTTDTQVKLIAIKTSTIKKIAITSRQSAGTSENSTFAIGINGTYTNFSTTVKFDGIPNNELLITGLSINVLEGQTLSIRWTTPTWVTNPTGIIGNINIYFE